MYKLIESNNWRVR